MVVVVELVGHIVACTVPDTAFHPPKTHLLILHCADFYHPHVLTLSHSWAHKSFLHPEEKLKKPKSRNLAIILIYY